MKKRHQRTAHRKPRAKSSDVLPIPGLMHGRAKVPAKWQKHYNSLVRLRAQFLERKTALSRDTVPEDRNPAVTTHMADAATDEFDRDLALTMISSEQDAVREIESAIRRIEDGTYGVCEITGKKI